MLESGWLGALPFVVAGVAVGRGRAHGRRPARAASAIAQGARILPLVTLPLAALFLYLTVSLASPYWAIAALCLGFACVELNEGNYWGVAMRLAPNDAMAATAVLNTGGNLGGVIGTRARRRAVGSRAGWDLVFATGASRLSSRRCSGLPSTPGRGART